MRYSDNFINWALTHFDVNIKTSVPFAYMENELDSSIGYNFLDNGTIKAYNVESSYIKNAKSKAVFVKLGDYAESYENGQYTLDYNNPFVQWWIQDAVMECAWKENHLFIYRKLWDKWYSQLPTIFRFSAGSPDACKTTDNGVYNRLDNKKSWRDYVDATFYRCLLSLDSGEWTIKQAECVTHEAENKVTFEYGDLICIAKRIKSANSRNSDYYHLQSVAVTSENGEIYHLSGVRQIIELLNHSVEIVHK